MNPRILKAEIDKIKQTDASQGSDIDALETAVGSVPTGSGNDLQSQVTAIEERVTALETADADAES